MTKRYDPNFPIVLGLAGKALTGKTCTANAIAPKGRVIYEDQDIPVEFDHIFYALPLYRMSTARQTITGQQAFDRISYELHETLLDIFGKSPLYGAPPYATLIIMGRRIMRLSFPPEGEKPREFLQEAGSICREWDPDCFVKWGGRKVTEHFVQRSDKDKPYVMVVSDIRYMNEARYFKDHTNGLLVKFTARPEVLEARAIDRDGHSMTLTQSSHSSETELDTIPDDWFDTIMDTSELTKQEQAQATLDVVYQFIGRDNAESQ